MEGELKVIKRELYVVEEDLKMLGNEPKVMEFEFKAMLNRN